MLRHEHFEEICAAASVGQANRQELIELEQHASECAECSRAYAEYLNLAALQFATAGRIPPLSPDDVQQCLDSKLFAERFFERADREGIVLSAEASRDVGVPLAKPIPLVRDAPRKSSLRAPQWVPLGAIAAVLLVSVSLAGGYYYARVFSPVVALPRPKLPDARQDDHRVALEQRIAELVARNSRLQAESTRLVDELQRATEAAKAKDGTLQMDVRQRQELAAIQETLQAELKDMQRQLSESRAAAATAQQGISKLRNGADELSAALQASQAKVDDLAAELKAKSTALDQARQLLALGHDVSDLMGARNLHIVDVVDTDPRGKTRPSFGRIFFTEGKSLIFYAYDLNEARMEKANYQYRVWAKKEGVDRQVRALGIFYSDDKAERRWVYKCDDPNVLREIDSVFVTLEPAATDPSHPKGPNLMYAYLRGQPNHP